MLGANQVYVAYEYLKDYRAAMTAYKHAHMWQECLTCASLIPLAGDELQALALSLAETLTESKDYHSAATIHIDYLTPNPTTLPSSPSFETPTRLLCKGSHFADALRLATLHHQPALMDSVIDPALTDAMASTTELLADCKSQILAQVPRLRDLRAKKAHDPLSFFGGDTGADADADVPDNISLAPTDASTAGGGSLFTRYTNRSGTGTVRTNTTRQTSKNRRREERKRARGKKGSVYEEEYLVNSFARLVERVNGVGEEVGRLVEGLVRRGMRERALAVEAAMVEVVGLCGLHVDEVFEGSGDQALGGDKDGEEERERPVGGEGVLWDSLAEASRKREKLVVRQFARLAVLGG